MNSQIGEKISAVEGLKLSPRMAAVLKQGARSGLTGDERRTLIKDQFRRK